MGKKKSMSLDDIPEGWLESITKKSPGGRKSGELKKKAKESQKRRHSANKNVDKMLERLEKEGY